MALRDGRGAGLRRAARGRAGFVALACALYLARRRRWRPGRRFATRIDSFLARVRQPAARRRRRRPPADRATTSGSLGHQLEHGTRALARPVQLPARGRRRASNFAGWPFGLLFWPLEPPSSATSRGWNAARCCSPTSAPARCASLWLRELAAPARRRARRRARVRARAVPRRPRAPAGTCSAPISMLLPLALWAFETPARLVVARGAARRSRRSRSPGRCTSRSARSRSSSLYAVCRAGAGRARCSRAPLHRCRRRASPSRRRGCRRARSGAGRPLARGGRALLGRRASTSSRATRGTGSRASSSSAG